MAIVFESENLTVNFMQICKLVINDCFQISKLIKTRSKWTNLNVLWQLGTWRRGTGPPTLPRTWRYNQQWGGEGRQTLEHFASARQGGRGQEQEGGAGEEGVQPRGVYWTCP